ncbi:helix-turn-helix transcriptional regulator [Streptomyces sp. NPDC051909]|uniref:helix-turn-helix domain-containing protein n=1 Tax=Streptomyces sp. NPDC051909 TaxID=3154944 RepID=UPI003444DFE3
MARGLTRFDPEALRTLRASYADGEGVPRPLSAEALGAMVGASKSQILDYEHGRHTPDPQRVLALAGALRVEPELLMQQEDRETWGVADVRRASGLRAQDILSVVGVSPKSYRRFEVQGIVPARKPRFLDDVAAALRISHNDLDKAVSNIPAVRARRRRSVQLIWRLAESYVYPPGLWTGPAADDAEIAELATLYGRPAQRIRRLLSYSLQELRHKYLRMRREEIIAQYDPDPSRQQRAHSAVETWADLFNRDLLLIPDHIERFHRSAQLSEGWQALIDLSDADAYGTDGPWVLTALLANPQSASALPPSLVRRRDFRGLPGLQLSGAGRDHVRRFADFYAVLFPTLRRPRMPGRGNTNARPLRLSFGVGGDARQERLALPPHTYELLSKRADANGSVTLNLEPQTQILINLSSIPGTGPARQPATIDLSPPD